ncbi:lamina-associated polypeptide 2-like isoform X2 [Megalops cyprinoides]|uniref:lamina-associated polypeptide 2-like isoform X2 n=1 Tax=Megalops cyprinoides TaxID=118141 RepID=UPI001864B5C2|nr:lamina-associated polypeptide 2-like isoform X2 [Megalops cyprinoides]
MSEFLEDPSVLTKDKLKSELLANNVPLPSGEHKKDVYVQLYLKTLTAQNREKAPAADTFSSDEDLPPPVITNRSRSGRKATRKTDKPNPEDVDASELTDESLREQLQKYGVSVGPIVASTRSLYERKLQKLLEQGPPEVLPSAPTKVDSNQNGNTDSDQYSDKEEEERAVPEPEPEPEVEPVPVVEKPVRSRGKATARLKTAHDLDHNRVEERVVTADHTSSMDGKDILKEMFPTTPTGISATCRRPIKGAAGRPVKESEFWLDESLLRRIEHTESTCSHSESRTFLSGATPLSSSSEMAPSGGQKPARRFLPVWVQLLFLGAVAGFLFFIYQAMETNQVNPFGVSESSEAIPEASARVGESP